MKPRLLALDSDFVSPPYNIALEEALRAKPANHDGYFLTYINTTSIIIGRNQSPDHEVAEPASSGHRVPVFRRTSGGGAVYHDKGNLNWTFVVPGGLDDRAALLAIVVDALRAKGIPASSGSRGEIMAGGYKIGGTASAAGKGILMFHGTILVHADLEMLARMLAAHHSGYSGNLMAETSRKGVASVPSTVGNASWFHPGLQVGDLVCALTEAAGAAGAASWASIIDKDELERLAETYGSPTWIYRISQRGKT
jgi:lipoate-protein ligase A